MGWLPINYFGVGWLVQPGHLFRLRPAPPGTAVWADSGSVYRATLPQDGWELDTHFFLTFLHLHHRPFLKPICGTSSLAAVDYSWAARILYSPSSLAGLGSTASSLSIQTSDDFLGTPIKLCGELDKHFKTPAAFSLCQASLPLPPRRSTHLAALGIFPMGFVSVTQATRNDVFKRIPQWFPYRAASNPLTAFPKIPRLPAA